MLANTVHDKKNLIIVITRTIETLITLINPMRKLYDGFYMLTIIY